MRWVKALAGKMPPVRLLKDLSVNLAFPKNREVLALGVILEAGEIYERLFPNGVVSGFDGLNQISATANLYDLTK